MFKLHFFYNFLDYYHVNISHNHIFFIIFIEIAFLCRFQYSFHNQHYYHNLLLITLIEISFIDKNILIKITYESLDNNKNDFSKKIITSKLLKNLDIINNTEKIYDNNKFIKKYTKNICNNIISDIYFRFFCYFINVII